VDCHGFFAVAECSALNVSTGSSTSIGRSNLDAIS
jgi:hypothetical protein